MRYFAPTASWNRPARDFGIAAPSYAEYVTRLLRYGGGLDPTAQKITTWFRDYSIPIVTADTATTRARVYQSATMANRLELGVAPGESIPWNPAWKAAPGNDAQLIIVDEKAGRVWEPWMVDTAVPIWNYLTWPNVLAGIGNPLTTKIGVGSCQTYTGLATEGDDLKVIGTRGSGLRKLAMVTRSSEVLAGVIPHALSMMVAMPMFGPMAVPPVGNLAPGAGYTSGFYCRPAKRLEHGDPRWLAAGGVSTFPPTDANRAKSIPSGMRFAIAVTDGEINAWLDARKYTGKLRDTARIFAVAMRYYGWIITDTDGYGMGIETDGIANDVSAYEWAQCGVTLRPGDPSGYPCGDLVAGLVTESNTYVVAMPS